MLTDYDRSKFEVFAYSNYKGRDDRYTALFKQNVTAWRNIAGISDEAAALMIREDEIDILVDLSGHSAGNRLLVFARRPAPIQITAWGYAAGTGLRAMDVFFADTVMVPLHEQHHYAEKIVYLHCALGSFFIDQFPDVNELPARQDGIVTFASFNRLAKVSDKAYQAWADILRETPGSRLLLKTAELNDSSIQHRVAEFFSRAGIEPGRIVMQGRTSWYEHMQAYQQVDIALDPFPQGGGITALEGLMMGVPMVALYGSTIIGRLSASILTTLNLAGWIANTPEQYVELAVQKSRDLQSLSELRGRLRGVFTSSVIGDRAVYVRDVEREYRQLWQAWCARTPALCCVDGNKPSSQSA
jgi:protein O-GlcNAc transferase